jgi:hypothetical protein
MSTPKRIQLSRKKGWRLPPNTVVVSRPTKWGNPCVVTPETTRAHAVAVFRALVRNGNLPPFSASIIRAELRGKNLACWCRLYDEKGLRVPCHADILLSVANNIPMEEICAPLITPSSQK